MFEKIKFLHYQICVLRRFSLDFMQKMPGKAVKCSKVCLDFFFFQNYQIFHSAKREGPLAQVGARGEGDSLHSGAVLKHPPWVRSVLEIPTTNIRHPLLDFAELSVT